VRIPERVKMTCGQCPLAMPVYYRCPFDGEERTMGYRCRHWERLEARLIEQIIDRQNALTHLGMIVQITLDADD